MPKKQPTKKTFEPAPGTQPGAASSGFASVRNGVVPGAPEPKPQTTQPGAMISRRAPGSRLRTGGGRENFSDRDLSGSRSVEGGGGNHPARHSPRFDEGRGGAGQFTLRSLLYACRAMGKRVAAVGAAAELMLQGRSLNAAAIRLRVPVSTLHRWLYIARNGKGKPWALLPGVSTGSPTKIARLQVTEAEVEDLAKLAIRIGYAPAYRTYEGRAALVEYLRRDAYPSVSFHATIRAAVAKLRKAGPRA